MNKIVTNRKTIITLRSNLNMTLVDFLFFRGGTDDTGIEIN